MTDAPIDQKDDRHSPDLDTLLVGIDAACEGVLEPLLAAGRLPTLRDVFASGANAPLESQIPPWTASAWPSLYTGTNPGKHGVFGFLDFDGYDWTVVNASHVRERPIWDLLSEQGHSSVVVNAPVTHPLRPFDGALVPGYMAPENPDCHPEGLLAELRDEIGEYRVYPKHQGRRTDPPAEELREEYARLAALRGEAFRYLLGQFDPDFGFVQFQVTDTVFHECPEDDETVRAVYEAVDREVGAIIDACDPDTVIVASDHGIGPYDGVEFRANEFLRDHGYVAATMGGEGMPNWARVRDGELATGNDIRRTRPGAIERTGALLARTGLTSQRLERVFETIGVDEFVRQHAPTSLVSAATEQVDFPRSRAYVRSRIECGVRVNLEGREPDGTVPHEEYEAVRAELIDLLSGVTTPDGDPVFEDVARREAYFEGPEAERAVDVVTVPADFDHFLSARLSGARFGAPSEPWNHKRPGVIAMAGDAIDPDASLGSPHLFDVAPTVLAAMGVPAAQRMDGRVLAPVESAGRRSYPSYEPDSDAETGGAVADRLADLGYIE